MAAVGLPIEIQFDGRSFSESQELICAFCGGLALIMQIVPLILCRSSFHIVSRVERKLPLASTAAQRIALDQD